MNFLNILTAVHVLISLVGIFTGFVVVAGFLKGKQSATWVATFLATTVATDITGYFFPFVKLMPSHILGFISLAVLAPTLYAIYGRKMAGAWRKVYVIGSVAGLYFNVFVLIAQSFAKIPPLKALAPTQAEPPFGITQGTVLIAFLVLGYLSVKRFRAGGEGVVAEPAA